MYSIWHTLTDVTKLCFCFSPSQVSFTTITELGHIPVPAVEHLYSGRPMFSAYVQENCVLSKRANLCRSAFATELLGNNHTVTLINMSKIGLWRPYVLIEYSSETKYDSGSGWPSFYDAMKIGGSGSNVVSKVDTSHGMVRVEVLCKQVSKVLSWNYSSDIVALYYMLNFDHHELKIMYGYQTWIV